MVALCINHKWCTTITTTRRASENEKKSRYHFYVSSILSLAVVLLCQNAFVAIFRHGNAPCYP